MSQFPALDTERLILREYRASDAQAVFDIFSQDIVTRHYILETMQSTEQAKALVATRAGLFGKEMGVRWAVCLRENEDRVIGSCGCYRLNKTFRSIEIGYDLHPAFWRQGIMTEALTGMLDFCFGDGFFFRLTRVEALTEMDNAASTGLLVKLGFEVEGIRREYGYWKGRYHDVRAFSLLRRDWEAR